MCPIPVGCWSIRHDMLRPGEEFASEDCPYFGKYGKYATFYDSDGYEYDDYTNPFHPDYD